MTTLQGKSYYEVTSYDPDGYEINPVNSDGSIISKIYVNFTLDVEVLGGSVPIYLPDLSLLNGFWAIEIVITTQFGDGVFKYFYEINSPVGIDTLTIQSGTLGIGETATFTGVNSNLYSSSGGFNSRDTFPVDR